MCMRDVRACCWTSTNFTSYTVEKIITHRFDNDGTLLFNIKWEGYEKVADRTWEPEDNLE